MSDVPFTDFGDTRFDVHLQQDNRLVFSFSKPVTGPEGEALGPGAFVIRKEDEVHGDTIPSSLTSISNSFYIAHLQLEHPRPDGDTLVIDISPGSIVDKEGRPLAPQPKTLKLLKPEDVNGSAERHGSESDPVEKPFLIIFSGPERPDQAQSDFDFEHFIQRFKFQSITDLSGVPGFSVSLAYLHIDDDVSYCRNLLSKIQGLSSEAELIVIADSVWKDRLRLEAERGVKEVFYLPAKEEWVERVFLVRQAGAEYKRLISEEQDGEKLFLNLLVADKVLSAKLAARILRYRDVLGQSVGEIASTQGYLDPELVERFPAGFRGRRYADPVRLASAVLETVYLIPREFAARYHCVALEKKGNTLTVGIPDASDLLLIDRLRATVEFNIKPLAFRKIDIESAIDHYYRYYGEPGPDNPGPSYTVASVKFESSRAGSEEESGLLETILSFAIAESATEVHMELDSSGTLSIRYRIMERLFKRMRPSGSESLELFNRIKGLAGMSEQELKPLEFGLFSIVVGTDRYYLRITAVRGAFSEKVIVRIYPARHLSGVAARKTAEEILPIGERGLVYPDRGLLVITGSSGHGVTTAFYQALQGFSQKSKTVVSLEKSPVVPLKHIDQMKPQNSTECREILLGLGQQEIDAVAIHGFDDPEVWKCALRLSLSGVLVLGTARNVDCIRAISYLMDVGLDKKQLSSALQGVLATRLIKIICTECSEPVSYPMEILGDLDMRDENGVTRRGRGCFQCMGLGYSSVRPLYEWLPASYAVKGMIEGDSFEREMGPWMRGAGLETLWKQCVELMRRGETSPEQLTALTYSKPL